MMRSSALLDLLRDARASRRLIESVPPEAMPANLEEAYAIAAQLTAGDCVAGWKIGATSSRAQAQLGLSEPFFGRILQQNVLRSPGQCAVDDGGLAIDPEIAFVMGRDLPPRKTPYTRSEVREAVEAIAPALELNRPSYLRPFAAGGLALIADNGVNVGACLGEQQRDWRRFDLTDVWVEVSRDEESVMMGSSSEVLGNPLQALTWLANALPRRGAYLAAGHIVLSGAMAAAVDLRAGQIVRARYAQLGDVQLEGLASC